MNNSKEYILKALKQKLLFTRHALEQMNLSERIISKDEIRKAIEGGIIIED
jgi:hypothetical protein